MKFTVIQLSLIIAFLVLSCNQNKEIHKDDQTNLPEVKTNEPDSVVFEKYSKWQESRKYNETSTRDTLILKSFEKNKDIAFLQEFLLAHDSLIVSEYSFEEILSHLYAIDINGDNKKDVVFEGPSGSERDVVHIYLNKENNFEKVFTQYQYFRNLKFKNNRLISFSISNPGCCADPQVIDYDYTVSYKNDQPKFDLSKSTGYLEHSQKAITKLPVPTNFTIKKDGAVTRTECYIFDIEHPFYGPEGNIVSKFKKGDTGMAIASSNEDGQEWLYVLMSPTKAKNINPTFGEQPTYTYGWILKLETDSE